MLLDEPTNHLDLRYQIETLDLVRDLADEHGDAVGMVLHDLDHAAYVADSLLLLSASRIHAARTPLAVLTSENISEVYKMPVEVTVDLQSLAYRPRRAALGRPSAPRTCHRSSFHFESPFYDLCPFLRDGDRDTRPSPRVTPAAVSNIDGYSTYMGTGISRSGFAPGNPNLRSGSAGDATGPQR